MPHAHDALRLPTEVPPPGTVPEHRAALGWSLAVTLVLPSVVTWVYFGLLHGSPPLLQQAAYGLGKSLQFVLPAWVAWRGWGGSLEWLRPRTAGLVPGLWFGLAVCGSLVVAFRWLFAGQAVEQTLLGAAHAKVSSLGLSHPAAFLAVALFYSAVHSLLEEYYWRWFVFGRGQAVWGSRAALVISSLGFMAHHVLLLGHFLGFGEWRTYLVAASVAIGGAFWAWLYRRTGNLTACWVSHALVDAGIFGLGFWLLSRAGGPA